LGVEHKNLGSRRGGFKREAPPQFIHWHIGKHGRNLHGTTEDAQILDEKWLSATKKSDKNGPGGHSLKSWRTEWKKWAGNLRADLDQLSRLPW